MPQLENGYTRLADELIEAFAHIRIPGEATQILWFVIRKTYGFNKKEDSISLSQFCLATGLKRPNVCRSINKLVALNIIIKKDTSNTTRYQINKDFSTWQPIIKKDTVSKKIISSIKKDNEGVSKKIHTKETLSKETLQKRIKPCVSCRKFLFEKYFWPTYPRRNGKKIGKPEALILFCDSKKIKEKDVGLILKAVKNYASSKTVQDGVGIRDAIRFLRPSRGETKALWLEWVESEDSGISWRDLIDD